MNRFLFAKGGKWSKLGCDLRRRLWENVVRPSIEYGMEIWIPNKSGTEEIEKVLLKGGRKVLGVKIDGRVPGVVVRGDLGWPKMEWRKEKLVIRFFMKLINMNEDTNVNFF